MNTAENNLSPNEAPSVTAPTNAESTLLENPSGKINLAKIRETIGYYPLDWQKKALQLLNRSDCQFLVIPGGKRVGKTIFCADIANAYLHVPQSKVWLIAPSYDLGHRIWDYNRLWADIHLSYLKPTSASNQPMIQNEQNGAWFKIKTADSRDNLKGEGLWLAIFDEGPDMDDVIWYQYVQPNVRQQYRYLGKMWQPKVLIAGNPQGKNWVYEMYQRALNKEPGYYAIHVPTAIEDENGNVIGTNNPIAFTVEELRKIKEQTPYFIWKSDYLAQFREDEGTIFKNLSRIKTGELKAFNPKHEYLIGWDPAKHKDFNVITVIDKITHEVVAFSRSNQLDYVFQKERLKSYVREYGFAKVIIDSTGLGEPLFDELVRTGFSVTDYHFTQKSKQDIIEKLALLIEHGRIKIPPILKELHDELEFFGVVKDTKLKYEAPSGKHDDCVMSLALACWELEGDPINDKRLFFQKEQLAEIRSKTRHFQYR